MNDKLYNVLFLCTGNSARSIMAEAILNRLGRGKFKAYSAGSFPTGKVNPAALQILNELNYSTDELRSKSWDEFSAEHVPQFDFVFTVCDNAAKEVCPVWPGHPMTAHWGIFDPASVEGSDAEIHLAFSTAYKMLYKLISAFVTLPIASLDGLALQQQLDHIGKGAATDLEVP